MPIVRTAKSSWSGYTSTCTGPGELHLVLFVVRGKDALQLCCEVRMQQVGFVFAKPQDGATFFVGNEVLIAIQKPQAIHCLASR